MDPHPIQLNDIALFVEIARRKSFSLAARSLAMPTSTLSRRISQLENAIGLKLINRNTRRLELTDAGTAYLQRCQGLVDEARLAHEQLQALSASPRGKLSIAMPYSIAIWLLPAVMKAFIEHYPDVECEFDLGLKSVEKSDGTPFDLILRFGRDTPGSDPVTREGVFVHEVTSLSMHMYASEAYLQKRGNPQQPSDLAHHECFRTSIDEPNSSWTLHHADRTERVAIKGGIAGNNISIIGTLSGMGLGITRLPDCQALAPIINKNGLQRVLPEWHLAPLSIYAQTPTLVMPAKTRAFMDFLRPWLNPAA